MWVHGDYGRFPAGILDHLAAPMEFLRPTATDLNSLPPVMIERVEVITGGASSELTCAASRLCRFKPCSFPNEEGPRKGPLIQLVAGARFRPYMRRYVLTADHPVLDAA